MDIEIEGFDKLMSQLNHLESNLSYALGMAALAAAKTLEAETKITITKSKPSGRSYKRGKSRVHIASAAGQPPAVDFGHLRNSITSQLLTTSKTSAEAEMAVGAEYGLALEKGTSRMQPRPFVAPSIQAAKMKMAKNASMKLKEYMGNL
jgi:HK97 gp10 family phage protein